MNYYWLYLDENFTPRSLPTRWRCDHFSKKCPKSKFNTTFTLKKLLLPLLSVSEIFLGWTVLDLWIFCPQRTPPLWIFKFYIFDQKPFSTKNSNSVTKTKWEKYPILSVLVIELKLFHTTEEGFVEDKKFITVHPRKISLTESRGNRSFFMSKSDVRFWFCALFGNIIAAPPGDHAMRRKIFIWA